MKNILLIGGAGYIGSVITEKLISNGNNVKDWTIRRVTP